MLGKPTLLMINGTQFGYSAGHLYYCKYLNNDYGIHFICYDRGLKKIELNGVRVSYVPFYSSKLKRITAFIRTSVSESHRIKPDVLYVVYFNLCFILALFCRGKEKLLDIRTGSLVVNNRARKLANKMIQLQSILFSKKVILSESLRDELSIRKKNVLILPLGSEVYYDGKHDYKNLNLIYIGAFDGRKIQDTINGLSIYLKKHPERYSSTTFTIIGFGDEEIQLKELSKVLQLQNVISFEGRRSYDEFPSYLKKANIGVSYVPITDYYNIQPPTKTFEYILSGLYTIATETFENKRIINSENGILCSDNPKSFSNALESVYSSLGSIESEKVRKTLQKYTWREIVQSKLSPFLLN